MPGAGAASRVLEKQTNSVSREGGVPGVPFARRAELTHHSEARRRRARLHHRGPEMGSACSTRLEDRDGSRTQAPPCCTQKGHRVWQCPRACSGDPEGAVVTSPAPLHRPRPASPRRLPRCLSGELQGPGPGVPVLT